MLHDGADSITLQYDRALTNEGVAKLTRAFTVGVKRHCEQMYNSTSCRSYSSGKVLLTFSSTACDGAQLKKYREETLGPRNSRPRRAVGERLSDGRHDAV